MPLYVLSEPGIAHLAGRDWRQSKERTEAALRGYFEQAGWEVGSIRYRRAEGSVAVLLEMSLPGEGQEEFR